MRIGELAKRAGLSMQAVRVIRSRTKQCPSYFTSERVLPARAGLMHRGLVAKHIRRQV